MTSQGKWPGQNPYSGQDLHIEYIPSFRDNNKINSTEIREEVISRERINYQR